MSPPLTTVALPGSAAYFCPMTNDQPLVPAVVVVHGALGSAGQMAPLVQALGAQRRYAEVQALELPGHGDTPLPPETPFSMETFARAIGEQINRSGLRRPVVVGYSMGGYAALLLEHLRPGTLGGILTLGTMLHWTPEVARAASARLNPDVMRAKVPAFASALEQRHAGAGGWETNVSRTASLLQALGEHPPLTHETLASIGCPVHLLVGDRDDSVTLDETVRAASHIPHARASLLPDTPHPIEKVSLELLTREVSDLAKVLSQGT